MINDAPKVWEYVGSDTERKSLPYIHVEQMKLGLDGKSTS